MTDIAITEIKAGYGDGDGAEMIFLYDKKRVSVSIFPSTLPPHDGLSDKHGSLGENSRIGLLERAVLMGDEEEYEKNIDDIVLIILNAGKAFFDEIRANSPDTQSAPDLHSVLYPESLFFRLLTFSGELSLIPIETQEAYSCPEPILDPGFESNVHINDNLPQYTPKEVSIEESLLEGSGRSVSRVSAGGKVMFCKAWTDGLTCPALEEEPGRLQGIQDANLHAGGGVRVPQLQGYVIHPQGATSLDYSASGYREALSRTLISRQHLRENARSGRRKSARRSTNSIKLVWSGGDAKASNVIVDMEDDPWLIDFGGGWTEGWVSKELADTAAGDKQGVKRIIQFLDVE